MEFEKPPATMKYTTSSTDATQGTTTRKVFSLSLENWRIQLVPKLTSR